MVLITSGFFTEKMEGFIMSKLYYCLECKRVIKNPETCDYCKSKEVNELVVGAPVNVIGQKLKGKVLKIDNDIVRLLVRDQSNNKLVKEFEPSKLNKVL